MERSSTLREIFKFSIAHLYFFSSFAFHLGSVVTLSQALSRSGNLVSAGNGGWKPAFRGRGGTATVKNNKIRMKRISCSIPQTLLFREISLCSSSRREIKKKRKKFHPTPQNDTLDILDILFSTIDRDSRSWTFLSLCLSSSKKENLPSKAKKFGRWKKVKQQFPTPSVRNHRLFSFRTSPRLYSGVGEGEEKKQTFTERELEFRVKIWYSRGSTSRSPLGQSFATSRQEYENHLPPAFCRAVRFFEASFFIPVGFTRDIKKEKKREKETSRLPSRDAFPFFHRERKTVNRCYEASRDRSRDRTSFPNFVEESQLPSPPSSCGYFLSSRLEFATDINYLYFLSTFSRVISNLYLYCVKLLEFIDSEIFLFFFKEISLRFQQPSLEISLSIEALVTLAWLRPKMRNKLMSEVIKRRVLPILAIPNE